jgi:hypothetical protein
MLDEPALLTALDAMLAKAARNGGSVLVTTSPRTPPAITQAIEKSLDASRAPALLTAPRKSPRYASLLAAADSIWVTADSVSMVSDAIWTGKPVGLIPIARSALGRLVFGIANRLQPGRHIYPQDLRFFWRALANIGIGEHPSLPRTSTDELLRTILGRAQQVLDAL